MNKGRLIISVFTLLCVVFMFTVIGVYGQGAYEKDVTVNFTFIQAPSELIVFYEGNPVEEINLGHVLIGVPYVVSLDLQNTGGTSLDLAPSAIGIFEGWSVSFLSESVTLDPGMIMGWSFTINSTDPIPEAKDFVLKFSD